MWICPSEASHSAWHVQAVVQRQPPSSVLAVNNGYVNAGFSPHELRELHRIPTFQQNANMENYGKFVANNVSWTNHPGVDADPFPLVVCLYPSVLVYGHFTQTLAKMEKTDQ